MRHVGVPDLDQRFTDLELMFNDQRENYECVQETLKSLSDHYRCGPESSLSRCLQKIKGDNSESEHINVELPSDGSSRSGIWDSIWQKHTALASSMPFTSCLMYFNDMGRGKNNK